MHNISRIRRWSGFFLLVLISVPKITLAATQETTQPELFGGGQWFLALLSLVFVVVLAYWATRFVAGRYGTMPTRHIKVAESLCLGPNRHLYLLLINNQVLLVGSSDQGISLIKEYDHPAFYEQMKDAANQSAPFQVSKFKDLLAPLIANQSIMPEQMDDPKPEVKTRLVQSLERIRTWKSKG